MYRELNHVEYERNEEIIGNLLQHGEQSLTIYKNQGIPEIYTNMTEANDNELTTLLKSYFEEQWNRQYHLSNSWFVEYLNAIHSIDHDHLFYKYFSKELMIDV